MRKGGRVVNGAGLENRNTGNGIGGSNPFPSATSPPHRGAEWSLLVVSETYAVHTRVERWPSG